MERVSLERTSSHASLGYFHSPSVAILKQPSAGGECWGVIVFAAERTLLFVSWSPQGYEAVSVVFMSKH